MAEQRQPRGPYKRGIERRREIVAVATEVFGEFGFKGGTLQQVAERVGVSAGAIMKLFGNKEQLLIAVLQNWDDVTSHVVGRDSRGIAQLRGFLDLMAYHVRHKGLLELYATMATEASSPDHPAHEFMRERYRRTLENMRQLFRDAIASGDFGEMSAGEIRNEAEWLLATMDGLEIQYLLNQRFDLERSFSDYVHRLASRLKAPDSDITLISATR
jgi:AcrR family transcriptional regulator